MIHPKLIIFSGANGAGKTTAAEYLLPRLRIKEFVNADEIARGLSPMNPTGQALAAGKLVLKRTRELIGAKVSFAIETTLAGKHIKGVTQAARQQGYSVEMHYIFCADINMNLRRITYRVKQGGHHVPAEDVRRRYWRSLRNFAQYVDLCDKMVVYDTTVGDLQVVSVKGGDYLFKDYNKELADRFFDKIGDAIDGYSKKND